MLRVRRVALEVEVEGSGGERELRGGESECEVVG